MDTNKTRHLLYMYYFYAMLFFIYRPSGGVIAARAGVGFHPQMRCPEWGWVGLGTACVLQKNGTPVAAARVGSQYPNVPRIIYYFETKQLLEGVGYAVPGHVLRIIPNLSFFLRTVRSSNLTCVLYCTVCTVPIDDKLSNRTSFFCFCRRSPRWFSW